MDTHKLTHTHTYTHNVNLLVGIIDRMLVEATVGRFRGTTLD